MASFVRLASLVAGDDPTKYMGADPHLRAFTGHYSLGHKNGHGCEWDRDPDPSLNGEATYKGMYRNDLKNGYGVQKFSSQVSYHGHFVDDLYDGAGTYRFYGTGNERDEREKLKFGKFEGMFVAGFAHGKGTFYKGWGPEDDKKEKEKKDKGETLTFDHNKLEFCEEWEGGSGGIIDKPKDAIINPGGKALRFVADPVDLFGKDFDLNSSGPLSHSEIETLMSRSTNLDAHVVRAASLFLNGVHRAMEIKLGQGGGGKPVIVSKEVEQLKELVETARLCVAEYLNKKEAKRVDPSILGIGIEGEEGGEGGEEKKAEKIDGEATDYLIRDVEAVGGRIAQRLKLCLLKAKLSY